MKKLNGWEVKSFNNGNLIEFVFWFEEERTIELTLNRHQFEDLKHALVDV